MNTKKYDIYSYWKDKAITKNFEVKLWNMCVLKMKRSTSLNFQMM